jgi:hypothetical protein
VSLKYLRVTRVKLLHVSATAGHISGSLKLICGETAHFGQMMVNAPKSLALCASVNLMTSLHHTLRNWN